MTALLLDVAGWIGAASLLAAYALVSSGRVAGRGWVFQLLNLTGGLGLATNGIHHGAWPSALLNLVWLVIGLAAVHRLLRYSAPEQQTPGHATTEHPTPLGQHPDSPAEHR